MFNELFKNVKAIPDRLGGGLVHFCPLISDDKLDKKEENKNKLIPIMYDKNGNYVDFEK